MRRSTSMIAAGIALSVTVAAQTPPSQPRPTQPFNTGSALDGPMNRAWAKVAEMEDAFKRCDAPAYERALAELEQMRAEAQLAAAAAAGATGFSTVDPAAAQGFARTLREMVRQRGWQLHDLKKICARQPQAEPPPATAATPPLPAVPAPQPPNCAPPPPVPQPPQVESILDELEEVEQWEKEQKAKQRRQQRAGPAGMTIADMQMVGLQQATIDSFDANIAKLKDFLKQGRAAEARGLADDLGEWLDWLETGSGNRGPAGPGLGISKEMTDKWGDQIDEIQKEFRALPDLRLEPQSSRILDLHNQARRDFGLAPLGWDLSLACQAASYGPTLAQIGKMVHSPRVGRETSRENLLQAPRGMPVDQMVGLWISERRHLKPGIFPDVSITGNWADVGHFTQMAWPETSSVGCAVQRGIGNWDWLICRYAPPGNRDGKWVGGPAPKLPPLPPAPPPPPP